MSTPVAVPIELPRPGAGRRVGRAAKAMASAARHLTPVAARKVTRRPVDEAAIARAVRGVFDDLGATFVKFGQLMGSAPGVFGEAFSDEFRGCLDQGPPLPFDSVRRIVEEDTAAPFDETFAEFSSEPIAAASIAVVHRARLRNGDEVAVKVLRPGIERLVATDLDIMEPLFNFLARRVGMAPAGPMVQLLSVFRTQVAEELDLRNEARFMEHYRDLLAEVDLPELTVPASYAHLSGRRVLTMEFLDGVAIDDMEHVAEWGLDPRRLLEVALQGWFLTAIRNGFFYGDVHAGNFMLLRDGRLGIVDWGIVGRLDPDTHALFRSIIRAGLGDEEAWTEVANRLDGIYGSAFRNGLGLSDDALVAFFRAQISPLLTEPFGEVSLATILAGPIVQSAPADEQQAGRVRRALMASRRMRRFSRIVNESGAVGSSVDMGGFLLQKQLLYFERYGKMFLADRPLLADDAFFRAALDAPPIAPERPLAASG